MQHLAQVRARTVQRADLLTRQMAVAQAQQIVQLDKLAVRAVAETVLVKQAVQAYRARATQAAQVLLHQAAVVAVVQA